MADDVEIKFELPDLHALTSGLKEISPKIARDTRRELRGVGDDIIAAQRKILSGPLPGPIRKTGSVLKLIQPKNGRAAYYAYRNEYVTGEGSEGGVDKLRSKIRSGLKTRITSTEKRSQIAVKSTGPRNEKYNMAKVWEKKLFRHPVFGGGWMYQQGMPYFWRPAYDGVEDMQKKASKILDEALATIARK